MAPGRAGVTVGTLLEACPQAIGLPLTLLAGAAGLGRRIRSPYVQKTGLALAGFDDYLDPGRLLAFAESEIRYLETLGPARRAAPRPRRVLAPNPPQ
jgi:HPr kinase/phosphorylase